MSILLVVFVQISPSLVRKALHAPFSRELVRTSNELAHLPGTRSLADLPKVQAH